MIYLAVAAAAGWMAAAFAFALWLGERGRRKDAQAVARVDRLGDVATVFRQPTAESRVERTEGAAVQAAAAGAPPSREEIIRSVMDETGCSKEQAEREADDIYAQLSAMGLGGVL